MYIIYYNILGYYEMTLVIMMGYVNQKKKEILFNQENIIIIKYVKISIHIRLGDLH